jgi:haloacid dehalogenase-like hydrolase
MARSTKDGAKAAVAVPKVAVDNPPPRVLAMVYDFDGTLSPRPMQEYSFLKQIGEDPKAFWAEVDAMSKKHEADNLIVYMHLMYKKARALGLSIDRADLVAQGRDVELFQGVEDWFAAIGEYVKLRAETPVEVRHYLISSGLKEIIEGTKIYHQFHNVFASEYFFEPYETPFPKRVITDTGKTQYLFRINKGVEDLTQSINSHMPESARPVPFQHMVYFGDGDTDVPSMTVMRKNGGHAIAVHG